MSLETKQKLGLVVFAVLAIALLYGISVNFSKLSLFGTAQKKVKPSLEAQILTVSQKLPPSGDSDGDGITNWQETILGTNPEQKDKPLSVETLSSGDVKRLSDSNNMTVALAKNNAALSGYLNTLDPENKANVDEKGLAEDILKATAATFAFKTYKEKDLTHIISLPTQVDRKTYGNTLAEKTAYMITSFGSVGDLRALKDIVEEKGVTENVATLTKKVSATNTFLTFLLTQPVPKDVVKRHLAYVNAVSTYNEITQAFLNEKEDPLRTSLVLKVYKESVQNMFTTFEEVGPYFTDNHLVFTSKDPGYVFTVGLTKK
jgi:hypothetical protein